MSETDSKFFYKGRFWRNLREQCLARDGGRCVVPGCPRAARVADHIEQRPPVAYPTAADVLSNLRSLCLTHDAQVKEVRRSEGQRKQGGQFKVRGCDADGWPNDPRFRR